GRLPRCPGGRPVEVVRRGQPAMRRFLSRLILSRENLLAVALCLMVILLIIATTDSAPRWIYQGF
ncbi:MAG: hypothetical protein ACK2UH_02540, partial [Candidatus Promineifilaceae bacterium]